MVIRPILPSSYGHIDPLDLGEQTWAFCARETWKNTVSVGGGYVETGRRDAAQPNYRSGADLTLRHGRRTRLEAEIAKSET